MAGSLTGKKTRLSYPQPLRSAFPEDLEAFPCQKGDILYSLQSRDRNTSPCREASGQHPDHIPEPPRLTSLDGGLQLRAPPGWPNSQPKGESGDPHFGRLYPRFCSFGHPHIILSFHSIWSRYEVQWQSLALQCIFFFFHCCLIIAKREVGTAILSLLWLSCTIKRGKVWAHVPYMRPL